METVLGMSALSVSSTGVDIMYIVYKTTNTITGDYYIGSHKLGRFDKKNLYLGSGKKLHNQIEKYGRDNFERTILKNFEDNDNAIDYEHYIISQCREDKHCLNLSYGGRNFEYINSKGLNNSANNNVVAHTKWLELMKDENYRKLQSEKIKNGITDEGRKRLSEKAKQQKNFLGRHHDSETKLKISMKNKLNHTGNLNSQFGTYWITDGKENKKWKDEKGSIPVNFYKGRTIIRKDETDDN